MDLARQTGQLFMLGIAGSEPEPLRPLIEELQPGGIILFGHNIIALDQVRQLTGGLQEYAAAAGLPPLLISIDQEGGRVARLGQELCRQYPDNWELGAAFSRDGDLSPVRTQARQTAALLLGLGVNMNLAPVLDVVTVAGNAVIGNRSYGNAPALAASLGVAYIQTLQAAGVIATAKHFPGHGPTPVDSHTGLPVVELEDFELRGIHLAPFAAAIEAGVDAIMPAHIIYTAWDEWPTTLSAVLLTTLLRDELGFSGAVVSDDLNMHAISRQYPYPASMVQAVRAGVDILLVCNGLEIQREAWRTIRESIEAGHLSELAVDRALERIGKLKAKYLLASKES
ncbi:beta-N-acetylhexosaminidase [bacterium]|nr:beta-N-acetylhexosaminidase [bacterium]